MPRLRVLSEEEVAQMHRRRGRAVDLTEYLDHLRDLSPGRVGEATLYDGERKSTIKRRLTAAAKQLGKGLRYRRSAENTIIYEVTSG